MKINIRYSNMDVENQKRGFYYPIRQNNYLINAPKKESNRDLKISVDKWIEGVLECVNSFALRDAFLIKPPGECFDTREIKSKKNSILWSNQSILKERIATLFDFNGEEYILAIMPNSFYRMYSRRKIIEWYSVRPCQILRDGDFLIYRNGDAIPIASGIVTLFRDGVFSMNMVSHTDSIDAYFEDDEDVTLEKSIPDEWNKLTTEAYNAYLKILMCENRNDYSIMAIRPILSFNRKPVLVNGFYDKNGIWHNPKILFEKKDSYNNEILRLYCDGLIYIEGLSNNIDPRSRISYWGKEAIRKLREG